MASKMSWYTPEEWTEMWIADKQNMESIMIQNMADDLKAGYAVDGKSIREQREMIEAYRADYHKKMTAFAAMTTETAGRWCFYDMKKRGVID